MPDQLKQMQARLNHWAAKSDEGLNNIGLVPSEVGNIVHAPKVKYTFLPPDYFIGKYVKIGFTSDSGKREYMWVKISSYNGDTLIGQLWNDPIFCTNMKFKDAVQLTRDQIIDVEES